MPVVAETFAPRVGCLKVHSASRPQCNLCLHRVVVGVAHVRLESRRGELGIGSDEVLREIVEAKDRAVDAGRNSRQMWD